MGDAVDHPSHYNQGGIECIDALEAALGPAGFQAFCRGNAIKYLWRLGLKDGAAQDARKAAWYLARLVASLEAAPGRRKEGGGGAPGNPAAGLDKE